MNEFEIVTDHRGKRFVRLEKMDLPEGTDPRLVTILRMLRESHWRTNRLRVYYGHTDYAHPDVGLWWGRSDGDEGYLCITSGKIRHPMLMHNVRSTGGQLLLVECIVRIERSRGGSMIYQHPAFHATLKDRPLAWANLVANAMESTA